MTLIRRKYKRVTGTGSALNAVVIGPVLVEEFASVSIQTTGTFSATLTYQGSNDGTNWNTLRVVNMSDSNAVAGGATAAIMVRGDLGVRWFRATITAYTSGTVTADAFFTDTPISHTSRSTFPAS